MSRAQEPIPLYTVKTKDMQPFGFDVMDIMGRGNNGYDSSTPHRHTFFELLFFIKGSGSHEIDFNNYPIESSSVHFVSPGQIHHLALKHTKGYVVCFTEDFVSLKAKENFIDAFPFYQAGNAPALKLKKHLCLELDTLVNLINREFAANQQNNIEVLRSYLNVMLLKLRSAFLESRPDKLQLPQYTKQKITQFKKMIGEKYLQHQPVADYAAALGISPNHLNALCKKHEGKTATQLLQARLLLESKRLLYATDMAVKEISFYLKFEDVPYFNRFFKRHTGQTPLQYRQQYKNH